jgi:acyl carrier protein
MVCPVPKQASLKTTLMKTVANDIPPTSVVQEQDLARLIVKTLNLDADPMLIDPEAPLYGEGLGLDSIDMLEIALAVSQTYGVKLRSDDKNNGEIFSSLASLNRYIQQHLA